MIVPLSSCCACSGAGATPDSYKAFLQPRELWTWRRLAGIVASPCPTSPLLPRVPRERHSTSSSRCGARARLLSNDESRPCESRRWRPSVRRIVRRFAGRRGPSFAVDEHFRVGWLHPQRECAVRHLFVRGLARWTGSSNACPRSVTGPARDDLADPADPIARHPIGCGGDHWLAGRTRPRSGVLITADAEIIVRGLCGNRSGTP